MLSELTLRRSCVKETVRLMWGIGTIRYTEQELWIRMFGIFKTRSYGEVLEIPILKKTVHSCSFASRNQSIAECQINIHFRFGTSFVLGKNGMKREAIIVAGAPNNVCGRGHNASYVLV